MGKILERIHDPKDLKKLNEDELKQLAKDVRRCLVKTVSETGGHLSSNLGVVELSIALHYVFNSPKDKLVWDVGHQSYVHKMLTGRRETLCTLRKSGGISGFPKGVESTHDAFDTGHSSTSISAALGMAAARDISGGDNYVAAIIGDGAMTAGMAYEALNNGADIKSNFIVILNDNQMSISKNVGGLACYLDSIRTGHIYNELKTDTKKILTKVPVVGGPLINMVHSVKNGIKQLVIPGMIFEELGYTYLGPFDGHDIHQIIRALNQAKKIEGPVLVHLNTVKGKGYLHAEVDPTRFHGTKPFETSSGKPKQRSATKTFSDVFGDAMTALAEKDEKLVAITAAMPEGTGLSAFSRKYPKRFFDVGIAEQHAVTFAAGLAKSGFHPVVAVYSTFLQRAYDQILHDVCIQNLPVTFCLDRAGIVGEDGETHQGVFDISYLSHLPNMTIMSPRNGKELTAMLDYAALELEGPVAIRYPKGDAGMDDEETAFQPIRMAEAEWTRVGKDIAVIGVGTMHEVAVGVARELEEKGKDPSVINLRFIKPMDSRMIEKLFDEYSSIIIIEENILQGGAGSELSRLKSVYGSNTAIYAFGLKDEFIPHGTRQALLEAYGLTVQGILRSLPWQ